ncbi:hypothetical protein CASFOL_029639 [Castilleja foliolosa]|uniref:Uncharacterized protein n=1 Tax=Castilleja foliolosa TaxID=1961234 RepID=A0ABD3C8E9_9LAMI
MAQTMLLSTNAGHLKSDQPLMIQRLKPANPCAQFLLPTRNNSTPLSSSTSTNIVALFKSKTKAPPKKAVPVKKEKSKVEDGVFGTSGGIGFTKQNELFVGRVAMIGFAALASGAFVLKGSKTLNNDPDQSVE